MLPVLAALLLPVLLCRAAVDTAVHTHGDLANSLLEGFHIVGVSCIDAHGLHTNSRTPDQQQCFSRCCEAPSLCTQHADMHRPFLHCSG